MNGTNGDDDDFDLDDFDEDSGDEDLSTDDDGDIDDDDIDDDDIGDDDDDVGTDTMVGSTAEFQVDEIVAKMDKADPNEVAHRREVRKRLEEIAEKRSEDLDSTFNFNLDDDL